MRRSVSGVYLEGGIKERACLDYHIHQCAGPCQGYISKEEYRERINSVLEFLNGNYAPVIQSLEEKMNEASVNLEFEKAIEYRELLSSVRQIAQKQKMTHTDGEDKDIIAYAADDRDAVVQEFEKAIEYRELLSSVRQIAQKQKMTHTDGEDKDIIAYAADDRDAVVQVFFIRGGKLIGRDHFYVRIGAEDGGSQILDTFLKQFYAGTPFIPREVMLPEAIEEAEILESWLTQKRGARVYIRVPQKGMKEKLVELAQKNAQLVLSQDREKLKREEGRTIGALKEIEKLLGMEQLVRVEAFDISNTNGFETVGSMIVYEKGKPKRSDYRKFKLKTVSGPDDYASMHEVLTRRFTHGMRELAELEGKELSEEYGSFTRFPDLLMMDGGRGQVNIALRVLDELKLNIPVCGMVKDDNHRTRGLYYNNVEIPIDRGSEGFKLITRIQDEAHRFAIEYHRMVKDDNHRTRGLYYNNVEIPIDRGSEGFKLITRIQDEAHRFAIEYHRSLRSKEQVHSVLDDISGIGPARRKALMKKYQSLEAIKAAELEDLAATDGMNQRAAEAVYRFFRNVEE